MLVKLISVLILSVLFTGLANAQLSPGTLYKGHSELEGLSKCTECHEYGKKVSNKKCLNCHKEIQTLISNERGYHYSKEVRSKDCAECHSDHHGLNFQIIRFDEDNFNHNLSGYKLQGKHKKIDCRECHKPDYIADKDLRKDRDTYLGMGTDCLSCHDDYHKGDLSKDCFECHNFNKFTEVEKFDHNKADFPLKGKHKDVDCKKCHKIEGEGDNKFQKFKNIAFKNCTDCHDDVHDGTLGGKCTICHDETSFGIKVVGRKFNHNKRTDFKLIGKHKRVACFECHAPDKPRSKLFRDYISNTNPDCNKCHDDVHEGRFGSDCKDCHTENSFNSIKSPDKFDHDLTNFKLKGKHINVECKSCHRGSFIDPVAHNQCTDCHEDYHNGELKKQNIVIDCKECHTESGFDEFDFDIDRHNNTVFPLKGAHEATPCFACHQQDGKSLWKFKNIGRECSDCHDNIHKDYLYEKYYPEQNCANCHREDNWVDIDSFDHSATDFNLEGKHISLECGLCHKKENEKGTELIIFKDLPVSCNQCHNDIHYDQFDVNGETDCNNCHTPENWKASKFNHDNARFKLDGAHKNIDCEKCHNVVAIQDTNYVNYKTGKLQCIDCHK